MTSFIFLSPRLPITPHFICAITPAILDGLAGLSPDLNCEPSPKCLAAHASLSFIQFKTPSVSSPALALVHKLNASFPLMLPPAL